MFRKELEIPEEWKTKKLVDIGEIIGGGTPNSENVKYWNGDILWAVPTDITRLQTNYIDNTKRKITREGLENSSAKLLPLGTVLLTSRATIGECAITTKPISTNQGFQSIACNSNFDNVFIFYLMCYNRNIIIRLSYGTTFLEISKKEIGKTLIHVPDAIKEQQKIASILSNVDALIESTQDLVEKAERLKKGLMQKLLTRGIGHTKFKKVSWLFGKEIEIPEEWEIKKINELGNIVTGNTPSRSREEYYGREVLWASPTDLKDDKYVKNTHSKLSFKGSKQSRKIPKNSILFVCIGSIGKIAIASKEMTTNQQINSIICDSNDFEFVYYQLLKQNKKIKNSANHTVVPIINKSDFGAIKIILPQKINEQTNIASILSGIDAYIQKNQEYKERLEILKKGLMQKLLTGKIRVKIK